VNYEELITTYCKEAKEASLSTGISSSFVSRNQEFRNILYTLEKPDVKGGSLMFTLSPSSTTTTVLLLFTLHTV